MWHLFIESGLHNIKRHMDFGLQECKIIIVPMDMPTVINRPMKFLVQSLLSNCPYLYYWSVSVWWNENVSSKRKCFLGDLDCCLSLLQTKKYISNKSCSFEVSLHQRFLKEKEKKISLQNSSMILEGSYDTEEWNCWKLHFSQTRIKYMKM